MVIDDNNASYLLRSLVWGRVQIGFAQEPAKARYFSLFKAMCTRTFEECTLRADYKCKLSAPVWFDFAHLPDQFNYITPVDVTWKAAG
jgi:hypothetical protein